MLQKLLILSSLPIFTISAIYLNWDKAPLDFSGDYFILKILIWLAYILFSIYSGYCTYNENLFDTIREVVKFKFGRQICLDLYLGLFLFLIIIFFNEPSFLAFLGWAIPSLFFVNLIALLYFGIHFDSIISLFV